jgi:(p)ppGpp synthase/HD superfamily hydrolase
MQKVEKAYIVADTAHHGQERKYSHEPYVLHCVRVYELVFEYTKDPNILAAALLHDTVEDTNITVPFITRQFGGRVASLVHDLTHVYTKENFPELNRAQRFELELERLSCILPDSQTIKYADLIDNTSDIAKHDPDFAAVYLVEKSQILHALDKGNPFLRARAMDQIKGLMQ